jgi:hypothetical protein
MNRLRNCFQDIQSESKLSRMSRSSYECVYYDKGTILFASLLFFINYFVVNVST